MKTPNSKGIALIAAGLLAGGLLTGAAANAQSRGPGWEFGADVIYQLSQDIDFTGGSRASLDDDFGLAISVGYRFSDKLEMQFSLDWQNTDYDVLIQSAPPSMAGIQFGGSGSLDAVTPRISANYNFMAGPLTPYVSAGVGWSFIDTNIPTGRPQNVCWWDPWWGYICGTVQNTRDLDEFTYQVGVGVRWDLGPAYTLRLAYEKHWLDLGEATSTPDFDQFKLGIYFRY
jgi:opacity protein-like surface antigen